ncbi:MAG: shikimate dehydrogenase [Thermodesulfovibrionales bacterium]|nr:shikimate dehydrogenase [Thermodesulfovibrionales bacterium]MDP3112074.1 shikimate dehydrogenase [Thermodesulfovibrionales bacterium]
MKVSGKTKVLGLLGFPVEHSLSPAMHNTAFEKLGLDCCYVTFSVKPEFLRDAVKSIKALNLAGVNVTVPHKERVIPFLDEVDKEASFIGAVNTIVNDNGRLTGYNTDGRGFMRSLSEAKISVNKKNVLVIGAGGASRAIGYYLCQNASELFLYDIDKKKAGKLISDLNKIRGNVSFFSSQPEDMDIIINATPLGLKKNDPLPIDVKLLKPKHVVCDLIYKKTPLLEKASKKGCKTLNGLGMLLWQGVFAFELWTGRRPPVDVMRKSLRLATEALAQNL